MKSWQNWTVTILDLCDVVSGRSQHFCMTIPFFWRVTSNLFFHGGYIWDRWNITLIPVQKLFLNFTCHRIVQMGGYLFWKVLFVFHLVPYFQEAVPGSGAHGHAVLGHAKAAHTVVVAGQNTWKITQKTAFNTAKVLMGNIKTAVQWIISLTIFWWFSILSTRISWKSSKFLDKISFVTFDLEFPPPQKKEWKEGWQPCFALKLGINFRGLFGLDKQRCWVWSWL